MWTWGNHTPLTIMWCYMTWAETLTCLEEGVWRTGQRTRLHTGRLSAAQQSARCRLAIGQTGHRLWWSPGVMSPWKHQTHTCMCTNVDVMVEKSVYREECEKDTSTYQHSLSYSSGASFLMDIHTHNRPVCSHSCTHSGRYWCCIHQYL